MSNPVAVGTEHNTLLKFLHNGVPLATVVSHMSYGLVLLIVPVLCQVVEVIHRSRERLTTVSTLVTVELHTGPLQGFTLVVYLLLVAGVAASSRLPLAFTPVNLTTTINTILLGHN